MTVPAKPAESPKRKLRVHVLKCRNESCGGLLAFEETDRGYLLGQVLELAEVDGAKRYFPCPKCGGRQLVEEFDCDGKRRVRVVGFEPA
ncbi:MAG: hypothetical protein D6760_11135 [Deltaproteobacteria bacterium]|nr:MAG: hypothetical protein D6760_11135 [Deltaproteobacteria bacterium]